MSNSTRNGSVEKTASPLTCSENFSKQPIHQPQPILGSLLTNLMEPTVSGYQGICLMPSNPISIPNVNINRQSHDHSPSLNDLSLQSSSPLSSSQASHNPGAMYHQALFPFLTPLDSRVYPFQASQYLSQFSNSLHNNNGPSVYNQTPPTSTLSSSMPLSYSGFPPTTSSSDPMRITANSWYHANLAPNQYNQLVNQLSTLGHSNGQSNSNHLIPSSVNSETISSLKRPLVISNQDNNKLSEKPSKKEVIKRKRKSTKRQSSSEKADTYQISSVGPNGTVRTLLQTADADDHFNKALKPKDLKYLENTMSGLSDSGTINYSVEAHFEKSLANFRKTHSPSSNGNIQKHRCVSISSDGGHSATSLTTGGLNEEAKDSVENSRNPLMSQSGSSTSCSPTSQLGDEEANTTSEETATTWDITCRNSTTIIKPRSFKPKQAWLSQYDKIIRC